MLLAFISPSYIPPSKNTVGVGSVVIVAHEAAVPFVVRYLPELLVCDGKASTVPQEAALPLVVRYLPELLACAGITYTDAVSRATETVPDVPPPVKPVEAVTPKISAAWLSALVLALDIMLPSS
jgi:hypothetical protein